MMCGNKVLLGLGGLLSLVALAAPASADDWGFSFGFSSGDSDGYVVYDRPAYYYSRPVYAYPPPVVVVDRPYYAPVYRPVCPPPVVYRDYYYRPAYRAACYSRPVYRPAYRPYPAPYYRGGGARVSVRGR